MLRLARTALRWVRTRLQHCASIKHPGALRHDKLFEPGTETLAVRLPSLRGLAVAVHADRYGQLFPASVC